MEYLEITGLAKTSILVEANDVNICHSHCAFLIYKFDVNHKKCKTLNKTFPYCEIYREWLKETERDDILRCMDCKNNFRLKIGV